MGDLETQTQELGDVRAEIEFAEERKSRGQHASVPTRDNGVYDGELAIVGPSVE